MRQFFGGFVALLAGLCGGDVNAACAGGGTKTQTVRITPGQRVVSTPQVVSNTITMGQTGTAPTVRVNTGNGNPRYIGGTPTVDVNVRAADDYVIDDYQDVDENGYVVAGRSGGQAYPSQAYAPRQGYYAPQQNYRQQTYRQPTTYQRSNYSGQPNSYYRGNSTPVAGVQNANATRYANASYSPQQSQQRNVAPAQGQTEGGVSKAYLYNKYNYGYIGMHIDLNLLNWRNTYKATPEEAIQDFGADHDDYRFKPVIGGNFVAGYRFSPGWRADAEFGFTANYTDADNGISFELTVPYVTANIYHDFMNGLYLGIGGGAAFPTVSMEWENFTANSSRKTATSFTGAVMVGYSYYLSKSLILDVRGRFSGFKGPTIKRGVSDFYDLEAVETQVGFIQDYTISLGIKYEF